MKRFLLFGGDNYYPGGGWGDFIDHFDNASDAFAKGDTRTDWQWFQVVDVTIMKEISRGTIEQ